MPVFSEISEGDSFTCSQCHSASIARMETEYEGFTVKRQYLVCAFCRAELSAPGRQKNNAPKPQKNNVPENKLSSLFGTKEKPQEQAISELVSDDRERRFCKNCCHNFITPFKCHCNLHHKEVEPLHDCPDFEAKKNLTSL